MIFFEVAACCVMWLVLPCWHRVPSALAAGWLPHLLHRKRVVEQGLGSDGIRHTGVLWLQSRIIQVSGYACCGHFTASRLC